MNRTLPDKFFPRSHHSQLFPENLEPDHSSQLLTKQLMYPVKDKDFYIITLAKKIYKDK
jgi:hypothetical protein